MPKYTTESIRTVALVGHAGSGKTTLAEALLHQAGAIGAPGTVERGTTVSDFDPLEKSHQHSLNSSLLHLEHRDTRVHLIDTPGSPIFWARPWGPRRGGDRHRHQRPERSKLAISRMMQWAEAQAVPPSSSTGSR